MARMIITDHLCVTLPPAPSPMVPVINGVQPAKHENGLSAKGESAGFEEIIQLSNHSSGEGRDKTETGVSAEPILAFEAGEPFLKKAGSIKPQHVTGIWAGRHRWAPFSKPRKDQM